MKFKLLPLGELNMGSDKPAKDVATRLHKENSKDTPVDPKVGADQKRPDKKNKSDHSRHCLEITKPCYMGVCEVTQEQWEKVMGTKPWKGHASVKEGKNCAASCMTWQEANEFCQELGNQDGHIYRLPTELEWEYACRAGSKTPYSHGTDASKLAAYAWYGGTVEMGASKKEGHAHKVGQKKPNVWGLYDMHGNVWEWCDDSPKDARKDNGHTCRGGGWDSSLLQCRSSARKQKADNERSSQIGLRVMLIPRIPTPEQLKRLP